MSRVNPVYLNLETIPPVGTRPGPEWVHIPGTVSKPETIAAYKADPVKQREGWGKQATDPFRAQVFVITLLPDDYTQDPDMLTSMDERDLFTQFATWVDQRKSITKTGIEWCTFNGLGFDFKLILMRAIKYRLPNLAREFTVGTRWGDATHKDLYPKLGSEGKLDEWADFFGVHNENHPGFTGADIPQALADRAAPKLNAHFRSRVTIIREINQLMGYV